MEAAFAIWLDLPSTNRSKVKEGLILFSRMADYRLIRITQILIGLIGRFRIFHAISVHLPGNKTPARSSILGTTTGGLPKDKKDRLLNSSSRLAHGMAIRLCPGSLLKRRRRSVATTAVAVPPATPTALRRRTTGPANHPARTSVPYRTACADRTAYRSTGP